MALRAHLTPQLRLKYNGVARQAVDLRGSLPQDSLGALVAVKLSGARAGEVTQVLQHLLAVLGPSLQTVVVQDARP